MNLPELIIFGFIPMYLFKKLIKLLKKFKKIQTKSPGLKVTCLSKF
jgi:hypothetical protein